MTSAFVATERRLAVRFLPSHDQLGRARRPGRRCPGTSSSAGRSHGRAHAGRRDEHGRGRRPADLGRSEPSAGSGHRRAGRSLGGGPPAPLSPLASGRRAAALRARAPRAILALALVLVGPEPQRPHAQRARGRTAPPWGLNGFFRRALRKLADAVHVTVGVLIRLRRRRLEGPRPRRCLRPAAVARRAPRGSASA